LVDWNVAPKSKKTLIQEYVVLGEITFTVSQVLETLNHAT